MTGPETQGPHFDPGWQTTFPRPVPDFASEIFGNNIFTFGIDSEFMMTKHRR